MIDMLKKTLLTGVGLTLMTKDKVEEVARELAHAAQMSTEKGQAFVDEAVARAEKGRRDLEETVKRIVAARLKEMNVPTREEIDKLAARLDAHEQHGHG